MFYVLNKILLFTMNNFSKSLLLLLVIGLSTATTPTIFAQLQPIYHQYSLTNTWYKDAQDTNSFSHSSMQPRLEKSQVSICQDKSKRWLYNALFQSSLYTYQQNDVSLDINFLPTISIGNDKGNSIWNNTRGFQIRGQADKHLSFNLEVYENQTKFPGYIDSIVLANNVIYGQTLAKGMRSNGSFDYQYALGNIHYQKDRFGLTLANDKLFIGDGYRSLLLSDAAAPFAYLKATYEYNKLHYSAIYMQQIDAHAPVLSSVLGLQKKWGVIHYLDFAVNKKLNIGLFDAVIWQDADSFGKRGFDFLYANPVIFLRSTEYLTGSSDNALLGLNLKYKLTQHAKLYGQFLLDECKVSQYIANKGWWANKFGIQIGIKSFKLFGIEHLNGFSELNLVKPYTYSHWTSQSSYSHLNESLAHPFGANFIEWVSRLEYPYKKWLFYLQINISKLGLDSNSANSNVGSNILLSYNTHPNEYGNYIGQGIATNRIFINPKISYLVNPAINMNVQFEFIYRNQNNKLGTTVSNLFSFGIVSGFRNLYKDR